MDASASREGVPLVADASVIVGEKDAAPVIDDSLEDIAHDHGKLTAVGRHARKCIVARLGKEHPRAAISGDRDHLRRTCATLINQRAADTCVMGRMSRCLSSLRMRRRRKAVKELTEKATHSWSRV